jgi:protein TonB
MKNQINNLDDLLFKDRNKEYGAYANRKNYRRYLFWSVFSAVMLFLTAVSAPLIANYVNSVVGGDELVLEINDTLKGVTLDVPKELLPDLPKEIKRQPTFSPPVIVSDPDEVTDLFFEMDDFKNIPISDSQAVVVIETGDSIQIIEIEAPPTYVWVQEMPEFPGGEEARVRYLAANLKYPAAALEIGISGKVYVYFVVDERGRVVEVSLLRGIGGGCDEEALRVISHMPDWKPGRQNGRPVRVQHSIPIEFVLR